MDDQDHPPRRHHHRRRSHRSGSTAAAYVAEQVELAYAQTSHASQGRTVDRSLLYLDGPTGAAGIFVPMTRGRRATRRSSSSEARRPRPTWSRRRSRGRGSTVLRSPCGRRGSAGAGTTAPSRSSAAIARCLLGSSDGLLERAADLDRAISGATYGLDHAQRACAELERKHAATKRALAEDEARLDQARAVLERFDKPVVRRRHLAEVEGARSLVGWLPGAIERDKAALAGLREEAPAVEKRLRRATAACEQVPDLAAERYEVQGQLDADAAARASDPCSAAVLDRVGPRPHDPSAALPWDEAAGRLAQYQVAWDLADAIGRRPQLLGDDAYALSYRAAVADVEPLNRALGRELQIEPPSRSLSRSL